MKLENKVILPSVRNTFTSLKLENGLGDTWCGGRRGFNGRLSGWSAWWSGTPRVFTLSKLS